ncbi:MAG: azoR [Bradyrhizobium sp.]|nr:azoR [Bradyrhizobium sp.]
MKLLHVDSSITGEQSVSRQLTRSIVEHWRRARPGIEVVRRDVIAAEIPHLSGATLAAMAAGIDATPNDEIASDLRLGSAALEEFLAADVVVIGAPMYNFAIPSQLKTWFDRLAVAGQTFKYTESGPVGLAGGKIVVVGSSRGGIYSEGPAAALDHQESYLRGILGFFGIEDIRFVRAEGVAMGPEPRARALDAAEQTLSLMAA